jgi:hypothetical protein
MGLVMPKKCKICIETGLSQNFPTDFKNRPILKPSQCRRQMPVFAMHDLLETNDCGLEIGKCRGAELEAHISAGSCELPLHARSLRTSPENASKPETRWRMTQSAAN